MTRLRVGRPGFYFQLGQGLLFLRHRVHTGSSSHEGHSTSYPMGTEAVCQVVKQPGHESDHTPPSTAEVKNA